MKKENLVLRDKVQRLMEMEGVSAHQIARETGIRYSAVWEVKNGKSEIDNLRLSNVEKYAELYDRLSNRK